MTVPNFMSKAGSYQDLGRGGYMYPSPGQLGLILEVGEYEEEAKVMIWNQETSFLWEEVH